MARAKADQFGSIEDVDFDTLIVKNADGSFTNSSMADHLLSVGRFHGKQLQTEEVNCEIR